MAHPPVRAAMAGAFATLVLPLAAHAASVTFSGTAAAGIDPLGSYYNTAPGPVGVVPPYSPNFVGFPTFGETAGTNQADLGNSPSYSGAFNARSLTLTFTDAASLPFNQAFDTGFTQFDGTGDWNTEILSPTTIRFVAPGAGLTTGTQFFYTVGFTNDVDVGSFGFTATWSDGVPEPASWAMMVVGLGVVGGALRQGRRKVVMA